MGRVPHVPDSPFEAVIVRHRSRAACFSDPPLAHASTLSRHVRRAAIRAVRELLEHLLGRLESSIIELEHGLFKQAQVSRFMWRVETIRGVVA